MSNVNWSGEVDEARECESMRERATNAADNSAKQSFVKLFSPQVVRLTTPDK